MSESDAADCEPLETSWDWDSAIDLRIALDKMPLTKQSATLRAQLEANGTDMAVNDAAKDSDGDQSALTVDWNRTVHEAIWSIGGDQVATVQSGELPTFVKVRVCARAHVRGVSLACAMCACYVRACVLIARWFLDVPWRVRSL